MGPWVGPSAGAPQGLPGRRIAAPKKGLASAPTWARRELKRRGARLRRSGHTPRGVISLLGLAALRDRLSPGTLSRWLKSVGRRRLHPLVRDRLRWLQLAEARAVGARRESARLRRSLGLLSDLWVAGPFDNPGGAGARKRYGPEARPGGPLRTRKTWVGKQTVVRWRPLPEVFPDGVLRPGALMESGRGSVIYLRTDLWSSKPRTVALRLGTPGPYRIWCNGTLVAGRSVQRPLRPDQDHLGLRLKKGTNALLIKLSHPTRAPQAIVRITHPGGGPARGVTTRSPARHQTGGGTSTGVTVFRPGARPAPTPPVTTVLGSLKTAAKRRPRDARLLEALARYHLKVHPADPRKQRAKVWAERLLALGPTARARRLLARTLRSDDAQRRALQRALQLDPDDPLTLYRLGALARSAGRYLRAGRYLERAHARDPHYLPAALERAALHRLRRMPALARRLLERLERAHPGVAKVQRRLAAVQEALGQHRRARRRLLRLVKHHQTDVALLSRLANLARRALQPRKAARWLRAQIRARPEWLRPRIALARSLSANGRPDRGQAVLREALRLAPGVFRLHRARARVALRAGQRRAARSALEQARKLRPQDLEVRRLLSYLKRGGPDPLVKRWAVDAERLARRARRAPSKGHDAEVLRSTTAYHVLRSGLARRFQQQVIRIHNRKGVDAWRVHRFDYLPDTQRLEVRVARILRADGTERAARQVEVQMNDPSVRMYYDRRVKVVRFPDLRPGDVIELQTLLSDIPAANAFEDYFGALVPLQRAAPTKHLQVTVSLPAARRIRFSSAGLPGLRHRRVRAGPPTGSKPRGRQGVRPARSEGSEYGDRDSDSDSDSNSNSNSNALSRRTTPRGGKDRRPNAGAVVARARGRDGRVLHRWEARDVPAVEPEPLSPGWAETHAHLHVSTFGSWRAVARWYWGLVREQFHADAALRRAAREAVRGKPSLRDKVLAIYHLVVKKTRYVALAFGMHTYKPYAAPQVFARKFGDCKDKAMLMAVMLSELGITAHPVLLRTRPGGRLAPRPPSLAVFNHAVLYVPALKLWLDGTAERTGAGELPWMDQGMSALIIDGGDGQFVRTPVDPASANRTERRLRIRLLADGGARVVERRVIRGQRARFWRARLADPQTRAQDYERIIAPVFPRAKVTGLTVSDLQALEQPVRLTARYRVPALARDEGLRRRLSLFLSEAPLTLTYASLSKRTLPVEYHYPFERDVRLTVRWDKAWRLRDAPGDARLHAGGTAKQPGVEGIQRVTRRRGELRVRRRLILRQHRWPVRSYPALRRFWTGLDQRLQVPLELERRAGGKGGGRGGRP